MHCEFSDSSCYHGGVLYNGINPGDHGDDKGDTRFKQRHSSSNCIPHSILNSHPNDKSPPQPLSTPRKSLACTITSRTERARIYSGSEKTLPRNYERKTSLGEWSEDSMIKALEAVKNDMPYRTASKQSAVPVMKLKRRAKGKNEVAVGANKYLGEKKPVFTAEQEIELVKNIKDMETTMYRLTQQDVLSLAYQLAVKNNITHPRHREKAEYDWLRVCRQRYPDIALRAPETTSTARARVFDKPVVDKFYTVLK
ncbi:hypothetical protein JTB14_014868 [Gonioctena quinquepunctata]|nr:hypothetical protein JTB14_014868 [Gonioctena quinquepunctata]